MSIRNALAVVKNYFTNYLINPPPEPGNTLEGNYFQTIGGRGRKRQILPVFEPEITDDEDEVGRYLTTFNPGSKRLRIEEEYEMASQSHGRYITRGSGRRPDIEGTLSSESKQRPEEAGQMGGELPICIPGPSTVWNKSHPQMNYPRPGTSKDIEVITLDDDSAAPTTGITKGLVSSPIMETSQALVVRGSRDVVPKDTTRRLIPRHFESNMIKKREKQSSNKFCKLLGKFGEKLRGTSSASAIQPQEMAKYKQLLMSYNIIDSDGKYGSRNFALSKSKVNPEQLQVQYSKFGPSPGHSTVEIRKSGEPLDRRAASDSLSGRDNSIQLPLLPKLYSTPNDVDTLAPKRSISHPTPPVVVDLEAESEPHSELEALSPIQRTDKGSTTFTNLEDALNSSSFLVESEEPGTSSNKSTRDFRAILAPPTEDQQSGDDITVIAEKIVSGFRRKYVNTLALEQTSCPYVEKSWLDDEKSRWRENIKNREQRIQEEIATISILHRDSTLPKDLEEKIRKKLTLTEVIVLAEPPLELPDLNDDMLDLIRLAKLRGNDSEVLAQVRLPKDTISITRGDIKSLGPAQWLNDNVINTYIGLIVLRSRTENFPKVYAFQTFFYPKLLKEGYSNSLKRWTRKDDIFDNDLIILPIHLGLHWCLACIDLRNKTINYYDSLGGDNNKCLHTLLEYISKEMKERKRVDLDRSEWNLVNVKGIPQQQNGSDCGMFSCKFAEYLSRDHQFTFTQQDMPYYRNRMIYELLKSDLMHP